MLHGCDRFSQNASSDAEGSIAGNAKALEPPRVYVVWSSGMEYADEGSVVFFWGVEMERTGSSRMEECDGALGVVVDAM